jgi:membrane-associated phospholipid phosphatase
MRAPALLAFIALLIGWASAVMQGPLPGDVAVTRGLQAALGGGPVWAEWLTETAKGPLLWGTLALAGVLAGRVAGWRSALAVPLAYAFAFAADKALRAVLFVPRPDPDWVMVSAPSSSSGLPSTFGLVYGGLFGVALLASGRARRARPVQIIAAALLVAGMAARIVLGGHWGSQMLASTALGMLAAWAALEVTRHIGRE